MCAATVTRPSTCRSGPSSRASTWCRPRACARRSGTGPRPASWASRCAGRPSPTDRGGLWLAPVGLRELVDAHRRAQQQHLVLSRRDRDPVRLADREPALGDRGHELATGLDLVLVVEDVALRLELGAAGALEREVLAEQREERLAHCRPHLAVALDVHGGLDGEDLAVDRRQ